MDEIEPPFVEGEITCEQHRGFRVRIKADAENSGGYYIMVWNPADMYANDGGDYWVEKYGDLVPFFEKSGWAVKWDESLTKLARPPA